MRGPHGRKHMRAQPRRRDHLHPVLGHPLDGADTADRRRRAVVRQELPDARTRSSCSASSHRCGPRPRRTSHPAPRRRFRQARRPPTCPGRAPTEIGANTSSTLSPSASASASDTPGDAASAFVWAVNNARPVADHLVHEGALGRAGGDGVDATQQQGVVREQQPAVGYLGDDGSGGVDGDGHRLDGFGRVPADQAHRIPVLRQPRRIGRIEHVDDVGQLHAHRSNSAIASTWTGQSGRAAAAARAASGPVDDGTISAASRSTSHDGGSAARTLTAKSSMPGTAAWSPW